MGNLLSSLHNASAAMTVFERGVRVVQNNVANVSTPGYARERLQLSARSFEADGGLAGGVIAGGVTSGRSPFAERSIRQQTEYLGYSEQRAQRLEQIEGAFGIGENEGIPAAFNNLNQAFSTLTVTPNDASARQVVLDRAADVATAFRRTSDRLTDNRNNVSQNIGTSVARVNELGERLREINIQIRNDAGNRTNSGIQAELHNTLEQLSRLANTTVLSQDDGSVGVYLGGQALFVLGDKSYPIQVAQVGDDLRIVNGNGFDLTGSVDRGELGAQLNLRNQTIPSFAADLDQLAAAFADEVNGILAAGVDDTGNAPVDPLFAYDAAQGAARTLQANPLTPAELAVALPGALGGNGNALALAGLATRKPAALNGFTLAGFFGTLSARTGRELASAKEAAATEQQLVLQAKDLRDQLSKVNLDEEAVTLLEFQRGYQAVSKMVQVMDEMTQTTISLLR